MTKVWRIVSLASVGTALVCALALIGPSAALPANADRNPTPTPGTAVEPPGPTAAPTTHDEWEAMIAADRARAEAAWADPATRAAVLAEKAAQRSAMEAAAAQPRQPLDVRATCPVDLETGAPPVSSLEFLSTSGQIAVIQDQCVRVYVGYLGLDHPQDGGVFVTYMSADENFTFHEWTYPGQGPLTLNGLTADGVARLVPAHGDPFTIDITQV
jgi:hypothetical protein